MDELTDTLKLVRARPDHIGFIALLARDEIERGLRWTWRPPRIARALGRSDAMGVVATIDALPAGFCLAGYGTDKLHVMLLGVDPDARRMGVGRRMIEWHERCALIAGLQRIELELRESNLAARRFYERLGFEVVARRRSYYQGREDALFMRRELSPIPWA